MGTEVCIRDRAISDDARFLAVQGVDTLANRAAVFLYDLGSAQWRELPESEGGRRPQFAPDGSEVVFQRGGSFYRSSNREARTVRDLSLTHI